MVLHMCLTTLVSYPDLVAISLESNMDIDKGPIMLTDHYHREYFDLVEDVMSTDVFKVVSTRCDTSGFPGLANDRLGTPI